MAAEAAVALAQSIRARDCPVCGEAAGQAALFLRRSFDETRLTNASFASRKEPEFMSYQLVRCGRCTTVFASEAPTASALAVAYHEADYNSAVEACCAATVYQEALRPFLGTLADRGIALEIGTGTGVFLDRLKELGFREQVGIEPSSAAIAAAAEGVKPRIRAGVFTGREFPPESISLICCFQTVEHLPDPRGFVEAAFRMLTPGGLIALITHDYTAPVNRMLGKRSPIIDIEHLQLFCPAALHNLITAAGYGTPEILSIKNVYPLNYWMSLLPLPTRLKRLTQAVTKALGVNQVRIGLDVGNLLTVAQKPR